MCKQNSRAKSSQEEVVSPDDENLLIYSKPVRLYEMLHHRSRSNPLFLRRCLKYKIQEKGKTKDGSAEVVVFNYKDCNNTLQKTEVRENYSCPFCYMLCGSLEGLQLHLKSFHNLFEFEYLISEGNQTVNVSIRLDAFEFEDEEEDSEKFELVSFCLRPRKRTQSLGRNMAKRPRVTVLPMDASTSASETQNGNPLLNNDLAGPSGMNLPAIAQSSMDIDANAVVPPAKTRKLSAERSEARSNQLLQRRQFYHSHKVQPMTLDQVMSGQDSEDEVDDEVADFEDRQMLDDFVDVTDVEKRFMHLWNSFVRKQRIVADGHIPWACEAFAKFHKKELLNNTQLVWCWKMFMVKLWNLGLLDAFTMNKSNLILEEPDDDSNNTNTNKGVDHQSDNNNNNNTNSVDHGIDLNAKDLMDVDEDVNDSKDK